MKQVSRKAQLLALVATLGALACLLALGTWQVNRLIWKEGLIAAIEARLDQPPVDIDTIAAMAEAGDDIEYRPVHLSGRFDHSGEQYFLATWKGTSGWHVYTPLQLEDGRWLFVNRGFVPYDRRDPAMRPQGQVGGVVEIAGLARSAPPARPSAIVPDNDPAGRTYYWKDLAAMRQVAGIAETLPFFVDAGAAADAPALPIGGVTIVSLPNNHLQYAITWFGIAIALVGVAGFWFYRQWRPDP